MIPLSNQNYWPQSKFRPLNCFWQNLQTDACAQKLESIYKTARSTIRVDTSKYRTQIKVKYPVERVNEA